MSTVGIPPTAADADVCNPPTGDANSSGVRVTFVGTLPPPVSGMTLLTKAVVDGLHAGGPVRILNWSPGRAMKGYRWKVARLRGFLRSLLIVLLGRRRRGETIYAPVSSRWGQLYDIALAAVARLRGYRLVVHHHVYSYIDKHDWRTALLNRLVGPNGGHVVHCQQMADDYCAQYPTDAELFFVPPTLVTQNDRHDVKEQPAHKSFSESGITVGILSNLKLAKGLEAVIRTFEQLGDQLDARLLLAGPCMGSAESTLVDRTLRKWPQRASYLGPVSGPQKAAFYCDIDVFLLPTRNESWGIVLIESLAAGKPVIAHDRGCIKHIVRGGCGLVVPRDGNFVQAADDLIQSWTASPDAYAAASAAAIQRVTELQREANVDYRDFLKRIRAPSVRSNPPRPASAAER